MAEVARQHIIWIKRMQPVGPYRLLGHSFGALLMFEIVQQLTLCGDIIEFLCVLDQEIRPKPGLPAAYDKVAFILHLTCEYFESFQIISKPFPGWVHQLHNELLDLGTDEMMPYIVSYVSEKVANSARVVEYVSRLINIRICNEMMIYHPEGRLPAKVLLFKAADSDLEYKDNMMGWTDYSDSVSLFHVSGDHHNMLKAEHAPQIARHIIDFVSCAACSMNQ